MEDWTSGYRADINYTHGYYEVLNPARIRMAMTKAGLACPEIKTACELGFGFGMSVNLHAAATDTQWWGTDFNPTQAAFAQHLAQTSGSNAHLFDQSFAEFCQRTDMPDFDFIGLHGVWTWISDENRRVIVDFIRRKLRPGGVVMASYNVLPGWSAQLALREVMLRHVRSLSGAGTSIEQKIKDAMDFAERLLATQPAYLTVHPGMTKALADLRKMNINYVAHEYFNRDWAPMHFGQIADTFESAKLDFACSARFLEQIPAMQMKNEQIAFVDKLSNPALKEATRDIMTNQGFRCDFWVKGVQRLNPDKLQRETLRLRVVLSRPAEQIQLEFKTPQGLVNLKPEMYKPVIDALADRQPKSLAQILAAVPDKTISPSRLLDVVVVLCGLGHAYPALEEDPGEQALASARKLNHEILMRTSSGDELSYLTSPVIGGGIHTDRLTQMFILSHLKGCKTGKEMAKFVWGELSKLGHALVKDGKRLETPKENTDHLVSIAPNFQNVVIPTAKNLKLI